MLLFLLAIIPIAWYWINRHYQYWKRRGIAGPKPTWLVGNLGESFLMRKNLGEIFTDIYKSYPEEPVVGVFRATSPALLLRDPDLIKEVTTKAFASFKDNDILVAKEDDPLLGRHPFCLKGDEWKTVRAQLTPGFTSGKLKWMYPHLEENGEAMVRFLARQTEPVEAKEVCTRFALNNVASCAFGLDGKCFDEENSEFRQLAHGFLSPGSWTMVLMTLITVFPAVSKLLHLRVTPKKIEDRLTHIVSQTLQYREENNVVRNDFLHILGQLRKTCKEYEFTDLDVTAHAAGFFGDGYETSSLAMSMMLFELALNPQVQDRLREEVRTKFEENNGKLPYDVLQDMPYLEAAFYESMRVHPPVFALFKICTKSHTLSLPNNKSVTVEEGTPVIIPTLGLHQDAKNFEEPDTFRPERFLDANKDTIRKCTYMPFGEGPRACLGQRFGMLQIKCGVAHIINSYKLSLNKKTQMPLKYDVMNIMITPIGGVWVDLEKIA